MDINHTVAWDAITRLHARRTRDIHTVLRQGGARDTPPKQPTETHTALGYALAHHFLEGAEAAAHRRDATTFTWHRNGPSHDLTHLHATAPSGPVLLFAPAYRDLLCSPIADTPYYLIAPTSPAAEPHTRALTTAAYRHAAEAGFGHLLARHAPITCLLGRRNLADTLHSWTLTRLPGTVFTEHANDPHVLARDLIHEAAHNWLNDALAARATTVPDDVTFFSPWRDTDRSAYGFLHACWAFSLTTLYTTRVLPTVNGHTQAFLHSYLVQQRDHLASAKADFDKALPLLPDPELQHRVATVICSASAV